MTGSRDASQFVAMLAIVSRASAGFYDAVDAEAEVSKLIDRWADLGDEINYREGYPFLTEEPELRHKLLAWGRETFGAKYDNRTHSEA